MYVKSGEGVQGGKKGERHEVGLCEGISFGFYGMKLDLIRCNSNNIFQYFNVIEN